MNYSILKSNNYIQVKFPTEDKLYFKTSENITQLPIPTIKKLPNQVSVVVYRENIGQINTKEIVNKMNILVNERKKPDKSEANIVNNAIKNIASPKKINIDKELNIESEKTFHNISKLNKNIKENNQFDDSLNKKNTLENNFGVKENITNKINYNKNHIKINKEIKNLPSNNDNIGLAQNQKITITGKENKTTNSATNVISQQITMDQNKGNHNKVNILLLLLNFY